MKEAFTAVLLGRSAGVGFLEGGGRARSSDGLYGALEAVLPGKPGHCPGLGVRTDSDRLQRTRGRPHGPLGALFPSSHPRSRERRAFQRHA